MRKMTLLLILVLAMSSCYTKMDDPLQNFSFGENEDAWRNKLNQSLENRILSDKSEFNTYRYYFKNGNDSIYADLELNIDKFDGGVLRTMRFDLSGDTLYLSFGSDYKNASYCRTCGPRPLDDVDKLWNWFVDLYGLPDDSIKTPHKNISREPEERFAWYFKIHPKEGSYIWNRNGYQIEFHKNRTKEMLSNYKDTLCYTYSYILFRIDSYESKLKEITEPIRLAYKPNDLIKISETFIRWENLGRNSFWGEEKRIISHFKHFLRQGNAEPRAISNAQFDLVFFDVFDNEIFRIEDFSIDFTSPVESYIVPLFVSGDNEYVYESKYNEFSKDYDKYERALELHKQRKLKFKADFKAIVFEDGEVLKSN